MIDHILVTTVTKCKEYEIRFTGKTTLFWSAFQTLNTRAGRTALYSNVHQCCKPKSRYSMCETAVKRISFFLEFLMLYEVYPSKTKVLLMIPRQEKQQEFFSRPFWALLVVKKTESYQSMLPLNGSLKSSSIFTTLF